MFVDYAKVSVSSGKGGDGAVAFRKEKFIPAGGPAGGDGGRGGTVFFKADPSLHTLLDFQYKRKFKALDGEKGMIKNMYGKAALDLTISVPIGTVIREATSGIVLADLIEEGETFMAVKGGRGGRGNTHFATATRKAPHFAEPGEAGKSLEIILELKLIADVGLAGLPNAGKSSLLACVSAARPKIADYPFTTLSPNLGVISFGPGDSFVMADIPGLIAGASDGLGLGHEFLRHIERNTLLLHLVDSSSEDPWADFRIVETELAAYGINVETKPRFVVLNKIDLIDEETLETLLAQFRAETPLPLFAISTATRTGVQELMNAARAKLATLPVSNRREPIGMLPKDDKPLFTISIEKGQVYVVDSPRLESILAVTHLDSGQARVRFLGILENAGVIAKLREMGIPEGGTVRVSDTEFTFHD
ncbi:MAG: GTPase ObgE [Candidatus Sericytochromatia bacterium]|nr:GTPase ObgE [Candidatus Sericytochromatia bacterium]